jgi:hypothetical protein
MYKDLTRAVAKDPRLREAHQKALLRYINALHRHAVQKNKPEFTKRAANMIFQLEKGDKEMGGMKDKYDELFQKEPGLKDAYEEIKKKNAAAGAQ